MLRGVFENGCGIRDGGQRRRVVHRGDGDGEGARDRVHTAIGDAAVVLHGDRDRGAAGLIGDGRVSERTGGVRARVGDARIWNQPRVVGCRGDGERLRFTAARRDAGEVDRLRHGVFEDGRGIGDGGQRRLIVHRGDVDCARVRARGRPVVRRESHGPLQCRRSIARIRVSDRAEGRLVSGHGRGAREGEHPGTGVVTARDAALIGEAEHVLAARKIARDRHGRAGEIRAVGVRHADPAVDGGPRLILDVGKTSAGGRDDGRGVGDRADERAAAMREDDDSVARGAQLNV